MVWPAWCMVEWMWPGGNCWGKGITGMGD